MIRYCKLICFSLLLICWQYASQAQESAPLRISEIGTPFINTYALEDHFTSRANYNTKQADNGTMYFANGWGLGAFDGKTWRLLIDDRKAEVYDIAFGKNSRVYVTRRDGIGYWYPAENGELKKRSLMDKIPEGLPSPVLFRQIERLGQYILFRASNAILVYDEGTEEFALLKPERGFGPAVVVQDKILLPDYGKGVMEFSQGELKLLAPYPEAGEYIVYLTAKGVENQPVGLSSNGNFFKLTNNGFAKWSTDLDGYLTDVEISRLVRISDQYLLVATRIKGVFILDNEGRLVQKLNSSLGLLDSEVQSVTVDRKGDLWVSHYAGLSHVILSEPLTTLNRNHGIPADFVNVMVNHKNRLYVGTNQGLGYKETEGPWVSVDDDKPFKSIQSFQDRVSLMYSIGDDLLVAGRGGFYQVRGNRIELLFDDFIVRAGMAFPDKENLLVLSMSAEPYLVKKEGGQWTLKGKVEGIEEQFSDVVNAGESGLWFRKSRNEVVRVEFNAQKNAVISMQSFGEAEGVPQDVDLRLFNNVSGLALVTGGKGVHYYNPDRHVFEPDEVLNEYLGDKYVFRFHELPNGEILTFDIDGQQSSKSHFVPTDNGYELKEYPLKRIESVTAQEYKGFEGQFWIGGRGITLFRPAGVRSEGAEFDAILSQVKLISEGDSVIYGGVGERITHEFHASQSAFKFYFGANSFDKPDQLEFQSYLLGAEEGWSSWSPEISRTYTNLPAGTYTFKVRARNVYGTVSEADEYSFVILSPWYLTWWAWMLYVLIFLILIWSIVKLNVQRLQKEKQALEKTVLERTEQIRQQKDEIEEQANRLRELDKVKSRFFANISHELRTPLTLINAPLESLIHNGKIADPQVRETLETATRNGVSLLSLVEEILDLAKLDGGKLELIENPVRVYDFMNLILSDYKSGLASKSITLNFDYKAKPDLAMLIDEGRCTKVVNNLVSNALKFTPENGEIMVTVEEDPTADSLNIVVSDTGTGIHPNDLSHIFNRYYQSEQPGKKAEGGTGIGLALAKELAELHGGSLAVKSQPGAGSTFTFRLPLKEVLEETVIPLSLPESQELGEALNGTIQRYTEKFNIDKPVLLITEDHPEMRAFIAQTLSPYFAIRQAENGKVALGVLQSERIDIVISDVMMPVMDGFELLEAIKADQSLHRVSLIMLTARTDHNDKLYALTLGIDDYLTKPFNASEFLARIKNILENRIKIIREIDKADAGVNLADLARQYELVEREVEVLELLAKRYTNPQIAEALFISRNTVKFHIKNLFWKMGIKTRQEAAAQVNT